MLNITAQKENDNLSIKICGDVDMESVDHFSQVLKDLVASKPKRVKLDAERLGYIFSNGLGVLIHLVVELRRWSGELEIHNAPERFQTMLSITKLDGLLPVVDDLLADTTNRFEPAYVGAVE